MADSSEHYVLLNQLADEFTERSRRGEHPTLDEYCAKYPHLADDIRELFPAMVELEDANAAVDSNNPPPVAEVLGDFRLIREIGRGGMGVVFEAEQISLGRRVALKLLTQRLLRDGRQLRRFEREARSTARLHHTNIVPVHGFGEHDNIPYFVMQFINGQPLDAVIREIASLEGGVAGVIPHQASAVTRSLYGGSSPPDSDSTRVSAPPANGAPPTFPVPIRASLDNSSDTSSFSSSVVIRGRERARKPQKLNYWQGVARIGAQIAQALEYAHGQGVVHRDVKPSNLLLDAASTVWVTDFGLAKGDAADNLTTTGDVIGTLRYMAPEALDGVTDHRSDIFSLGLTLYEMLALRPAYDQRDRNALVKQVTEASPPKLRSIRPQIPADLETIIHKAIEREPGRRYATAGEFADDLHRFLKDEPIRARPQTSLEAFWRWTRQHKAVATLMSAVATLTIALAAGAVVTAAYYREQETTQRKLVKAKSDFAEQNQKLASENDEARREAQAARDNAERVVWEMQTARAFLAAEADDPARAALWFASAAQQAAGDPVRQAGSLLRARNWLRETHAPLSTFSLNEFPQRMEFRAGGDLLLIVAGDKLTVRNWRNDRNLPWTTSLKDVADARFSPDGETIGVAIHGGRSKPGPGRLELRDAATGKVRHTYASSGPVLAIVFSADGRYAAFAGDAVQVIDMSSGKLLQDSAKLPAMAHSLIFDPRSELLATACVDGNARVVSVSEMKPVGPTIVHQSVYGSPPAFLKPGRRLASVGADGELVLTDLDSGKSSTQRLVLLERRGRVPSVVAPPSGDWVAMTGFSRTVILPAAEGARKIEIQHPIWNEDLACTPDGAFVVTAGWEYTVRLWDAATGRSFGSPLPHTEIVRQVTVAPDGRHLATFGGGVVRLWRLGETDSARVAHDPWYWSPRLSADGRLAVPGLTHEFGWLSAPGVQDSRPLRAFLTASGNPAGPPVRLRGTLIDCCISADAKTMAAVSWTGTQGWLEFHDAYSGRRTAAAYRLSAEPFSIAPRPLRNEVAVLCTDGSLHVVDVAKGAKCFVVKLSDWGVPPILGKYLARVRYTGDGATMLVVDPIGRRVDGRDADSGAARFPSIVPVLSGGPIRSLAVSNDGRYFATGVNGANAAQVWDAHTGAACSSPLLHQGDAFGIWHVAFTPDGERLLTTCTDRQALLWDWRKGVMVSAPMKHGDEVYRAEPTPDGRFAFTVSREQPCRLRLWEIPSGRLVAPTQHVGPKNLRAPFATLHVLPDGGALAGPGSGVTRFDFSDFLEPPEWSADEYQLLAEVASGQRIENGHERSLTFDEWRQRLNRLALTRPELIHPEPAEEAERLRRYSARLRDAGLPAEATAAARAAVAELERASSPDAFLLGRARLELATLQQRAGATPDFAAILPDLEAAVAERPNDADRVSLLAEALMAAPRPPQTATHWTPLKPRTTKAVSGATLAVQADGSLLASGPNADYDAYIITAPLEGPGVTALRLEVLPDPSLPQQGPGRFPNGNFQLSEFEAALSEGGMTTPLRFQDGGFLSARYRSNRNGDAGPALAIDRAPRTAMDAFPKIGVRNVAAFVLAAPTRGLNAELVVTLRQGTEIDRQHNLGRFRLSTCADPHPLRPARLRDAFPAATPPCKLGIARLFRGETEPALQALERATRTGSLLSWALYDLALQGAGKKADADRAFAETWKVWEETDATMEEAAIVFEALASRLTAHADRPELLARRMRCRAALGLGPLAAEDFARLVSKEPSFAFAPSDVAVLIAAGDGAAERGDWDTAIRAFDQALQLDADSPLAAEGTLVARLGKGDLADFRKRSRELFQQCGSSPSALGAASAAECLKGDALTDRKAVLAAVRAWSSAEPSRATVAHLAAALGRAGDAASALAMLDEAARRWPGSPDPYESAYRAIILARAGDKDAARKALEQAEAARRQGRTNDATAVWTARVAREALVKEARSLLK